MLVRSQLYPITEFTINRIAQQNYIELSFAVRNFSQLHSVIPEMNALPYEVSLMNEITAITVRNYQHSLKEALVIYEGYQLDDSAIQQLKDTMIKLALDMSSTAERKLKEDLEQKHILLSETVNSMISILPQNLSKEAADEIEKTRSIAKSQLLSKYEESVVSLNKQPVRETSNSYDLFISHASEDKVDFVDDFVSKLKDKELNPFYDSNCISWGDNLVDKIQEGLRQTNCGVVIISNHFLNKSWPEKELATMTNLMVSKSYTIYPLLHGVDYDSIASKHPILAPIKMLNTSEYTTEYLADILHTLCKKPQLRY